MKKSKKILIIGGGMAGSSSAEMLSKEEENEIYLVEKSGYLGAGVRTFWYGGHPHTFGPRYFLTPYQKVYDYFNKIVPLRDCSDHQFITYVERDRDFYNYPMHKDDINRMPDKDIIHEQLKTKKENFTPNNLEEYWINSVGFNLFDKLINNYNKKMWKISDCKEIDTFSWSPKGATLKESGSKRMPWEGTYSGYPFAPDGYNKYFEILKNRKNLKIILNSSVKFSDIKKKQAIIDEEKITFDIVINTISPDILFNYSLGKLPYLGRDIHHIVLPVENVLPGNVFFIYYANNEKFTRVVEYKKFTQHKSPQTLLALEIPSENGKHYPMPIKKYQSLAKQYLDELPEGFYSIGRAGSYFYSLDMDDCIMQSMLICEDLKNTQLSSGILGDQYVIEKRV